MRAEEITALVLTFNEEANIRRTLDHLSWIPRVIVVDSRSTDSTLAIVQEFPNTRVVQRPFDNHAAQWNFGLADAGIETEWVLALDADYVVPKTFADEVLSLQPAKSHSGYQARFRYCIGGTPLDGSAYPPVTVLYRKSRARYVQDGHSQRVSLDGDIVELRSPIDHDDRKPLHQWLHAQSRYMRLEAEKLLNLPASSLSFSDRLRKLVVIAPIAMFFYCLIVKGNILNGRAGLYYAMQRSLAEGILSVYLLDNQLRKHWA
jgi:glycosyltransferase involved in cell wall biosynthesis